MACGPGHPELSKSYMDMAIKLFTFTLQVKSQNIHQHSNPARTSNAPGTRYTAASEQCQDGTDQIRTRHVNNILATS